MSEKSSIREDPADNESVEGSPLEEGIVEVPDLMRNLGVAGVDNLDLLFAHAA